MLTSSDHSSAQDSWDIVNRYAGMVSLAVENADLNNWNWNEPSKSIWKLATQDWQDFGAKWYGTPVDPNSTSLSLEPLPVTSSSIVARRSYVELFNHVWARAMSSEGMIGTLITGQSGTGKTMFLYYLLIRLLEHKQPVLFSVNCELLLFFHGSVYITTRYSLTTITQREILPEPQSRQSKVFIWSLIDTWGQKEPETFLVKQPCLPVQSASLDPCQYKTWYKRERPLVVGLPLWSRDELAQGLPYQKLYRLLMKLLSEDSSSASDPLDILPGTRAIIKEREEGGVISTPENAISYLLDAAIDRVGYSTHDVFGAVFHPSSVTMGYKNTLRISYDDLFNAFFAHPLALTQIASRAISHNIISLSPVYGDPFVHVGWNVNFTSDCVAKSVISQLNTVNDDELRRRIRTLESEPKTRPFARQYRELLFHRIVNSTSGSWQLLRMASNDADPPCFTQHPLPNDSDKESVHFPLVKRMVVQFESLDNLLMQNNVYYMPTDPNFALLDAFTIDIDFSKNSAILWALHITTSHLDGGSSRGYLNIRKIVARLKAQIRGDVQVRKTRKVTAEQNSSTPRVKVIYLFVFPFESDSPPKWHLPKGWNENCSKHDHRGDAYCMWFS